MKSRNLSVLVVDDDVDSASVLADLLILSGYRAFPVFSGNEAIAVAKKDPVDVAFIDILMPEMDGFRIAEELRILYEERRLLLVAYTGVNCSTLKGEAVGRGFDAVVQKPATVATFVDLISTYFAEVDSCLNQARDFISGGRRAERLAVPNFNSGLAE